MAFLELTHVKKTFGRWMNQVHALRDINLTVERGSFVAIMGESGAGKSTLLNIIATLTPATAGTVTLAGNDITALNEAARAKFRRQHIGFIFQHFNLLPELNNRDNILLPVILANKTDKHSAEQVDELAEFGRITGDCCAPITVSGRNLGRAATTSGSGPGAHYAP